MAGGVHGGTGSAGLERTGSAEGILSARGAVKLWVFTEVEHQI